MLMLALLKRLSSTELATRAGRFEPAEVIEAGIDDLADATVGLIGLGQIGQGVAERLVAFGPRILYATRHPVPEAEARLGLEWRPIPELLAASTIVSLHLPLSAETRHLIGAAELASMPRGTTSSIPVAAASWTSRPCARRSSAGTWPGRDSTSSMPSPRASTRSRICRR